MGLDQKAFIVPSKFVTSEVDAVLPDEKIIDIAEWRKHPNLQGWMERLYRRKGGQSPDFNLENNVRLTLEDLDQLEKDVVEGRLPPTTGFFFGNNSDDYYLSKDKEFIRAARADIANGFAVFYSSWW